MIYRLVRLAYYAVITSYLLLIISSVLFVISLKYSIGVTISNFQDEQPLIKGISLQHGWMLDYPLIIDQPKIIEKDIYFRKKSIFYFSDKLHFLPYSYNKKVVFNFSLKTPKGNEKLSCKIDLSKRKDDDCEIYFLPRNHILCNC